MSKGKQMVAMVAVIVGLLCGVNAAAGNVADTSEVLVTPATPVETYTATVYPVDDSDASYDYAQQLIGLGWYGVAGDGCECVYSPDPATFDPGLNFWAMSDVELVDTVNASSDALRHTLAATGNLPEAPMGYAYAEDYSLVPVSYWA